MSTSKTVSESAVDLDGVMKATRSRWADGRAVALGALKSWVEASVTAAAALADAAGVTGPDRLVTLTGGTAVSPAGSGTCPDCGAATPEVRETLLSVGFSASGRQVQLTLGAELVDVWTGAVEVWSELRDALSAATASTIPVGLVIDVDAGVVACFEEEFCPEIGPGPLCSVHVSALADDAPSADPFEEMLHAEEHDRERAERFAASAHRFETLVEKYRLVLPTRPHPSDEECEECASYYEEWDDDEDDSDEDDE